MHPNDGPGLNQVDLSQWWDYIPYGHGTSYTWRTVPDFETYASQRPGYQVRTDPGYTRRGDLILMDTNNDRTVDHSKVIVGMGYMSPYSTDYDNRLPGWSDLSSTFTYELMTSAHTNDRWHVPLCFSYDCNNIYTRYVRIVP